MNRFLGYERSIVSSTPGTTRDAIDSRIQYHGQEIVLMEGFAVESGGAVALVILPGTDCF